MPDDNTVAKVAGGVGVFTGLVGAIAAIGKWRSDDSSQFRRDILERMSKMEARDNDQQAKIDRLTHDLQMERERSGRQNLVIWKLADLVKKLMGEQNELLAKHGEQPKYTERDWTFPEIEER